MKYLLFILFLLPAMVFATGKPVVFNESRTYAHENFETSADCEAAQRDGFMNCSQTVTFEPDGTAVMMVTDIPSDARYEVQGNQVIITAEGPGDLPERAVFEFSDNRRHLIRKGTNEVWDLQTSKEKK